MHFLFIAEFLELYQLISFFSLLLGKDACVMAVLDLDEVGEDAHHLERGTFQKDADGRWIPRRHPRLFTLEEYKSIREKSKL